MLVEVFQNIQKNKVNYAVSRNGDQFEQWFKSFIKSRGFAEILQTTKTNSAIKNIANFENISFEQSKKIFQQIKSQILLKNASEIVTNPYHNINCAFIHQPYGSQNFPDFIFFIYQKVVPVEIKYTKNDDRTKNLHSVRPMWNSNMPKPNAIYIYGLANERITFFKGSAILDWNTRQVLLDFFTQIAKNEGNLNQKLTNLKNNFGFYPYIRKAYEHKKNKSTLFDVTGKKTIESYFSVKAIDRENEVIAFFQEMAKRAIN